MLVEHEKYVIILQLGWLRCIVGAAVTARDEPDRVADGGGGLPSVRAAGARGGSYA